VLADGRLLVAGGKSSEHLLLRSVEAYNALTNDWEVLSDMSTPRYGCAAARLADGRALVIGGRGSNGFLATVEAYSPQLKIWGQVAKMREARYLFACATLADGRVLVAGGVNARSKHSPLASVEIFDPMAGPASGGMWPPGEWTAVSTMKMGREAAACTTMTDGRVVVMGGRGARLTHNNAVTSRTQPPPMAKREYLDSVEVYDPDTDRWSDNLAPELHSGRFGGASVSLGGMVILLGGADGHGELNRVESWDPLVRRGSDHKHREWMTLAPMGKGVGRVMAAVSSVQFS
jgi:N-acetylneuraminic acid mutarotase